MNETAREAAEGPVAERGHRPTRRGRVLAMRYKEVD